MFSSQPELAYKLLNLCLYYVNSNHAELREKYRQIFTMLPAMLVVFNIGKAAMVNINPKA
jgi:hypothetical protein